MSDSANASAAAGVVEPEPERKRKRGRSIPILGDVSAIFDAKPMSATEAKASRDELIESYAQWATLADDAISRTNRARAEAVIWSTMTDDDLGTLADMQLELARTSPVVAQAVRGMIRSNRLVKAGLIVGPRAWATMQHYASNGGLALWVPS